MSESLKRQLLEWIDAAPRSYRETMEAWRTSCPRLSIWEDVQAEGLVEVRPTDQLVVLSEKGRQLLDS